MGEHAPQSLTTSQAAQDSPHTGGRLVLNVTSDPANLAPVRRACEAFCRSQGLDDGAINDVGLCVNEAMANVIRHAYGNRTDKPIAVTAAADERQIEITLRDWGNGVNPATLPHRPHDPNTPGGVGLICLKQWMDQVSYAPQSDGGILATMIRRRKR